MLDDGYAKTEDLKRLRLLRAARVGTPTTESPTRRFAIALAVSEGLVEVAGRRRSGVLLRLTKRGLDELAILEKAYPGLVDYSARQAARRAGGG